jgi:hypothetical protein
VMPAGHTSAVRGRAVTLKETLDPWRLEARCRCCGALLGSATPRGIELCPGMTAHGPGAYGPSAHARRWGARAPRRPVRVGESETILPPPRGPLVTFDALPITVACMRGQHRSYIYRDQLPNSLGWGTAQGVQRLAN